MKKRIWFCLCRIMLCGCSPVNDDVSETTTAAQLPAETTTTEEPVSQESSGFESLEEDEMFVAYGASSDFADLTEKLNLTIYDRNGEIIEQFCDAAYEGTPGVYKKSHLLVIGITELAESESSSQHYGLYSAEEGRFVLEPVYTRISLKENAPGVYQVYRYHEDTGETENFYYTDRQCIEGNDYTVCGDYVWITHYQEMRADIYKDAELIKTLENISNVRNGVSGRAICYVEGANGIRTCIYEPDGTLLFDQAEWMRRRGIPEDSNLYVAGECDEAERILISGGNTLWLCDYAGTVLEEFDAEKYNLWFQYGYPALKCEERENYRNTVIYDADGQILKAADGTVFDSYIGGSSFGYHKDGNLHIEDVETGETLLLENVIKDEDYAVLFGDGIIRLYRSTRNQYVFYNWDGPFTESLYADCFEKGDKVLIRTYGETTFADWGYGIGYVADWDGNILYQSPMKEYMVWSDGEFVIARRGNYICVLNSEGEILDKQIDPEMADD